MTEGVPKTDPQLECALEMLSALAAVIETAHTEARLLPAISDALSIGLPVARVLRAERHDAARCLRVPLADGPPLVIELSGDAVLEARVPWGGALEDAIAAHVRAAFAQARTLAKVAAVSRRAYGESARLRSELASANDDRVVAVSPAMRRLVHEVVPLVARQDVTVLIRGESGTGKEVIARRIHQQSRRAKRPFVALNCAALPESLAESALFGHERGAFTGAIARHIGVFERASGGTLLLDEVGELTPSMQARLLRVLQEGTLERVGGTSTVRVDARVIAATHRPLERMIEEGRFRQDLFYRLAVVPLEIPPLRDRPEDIEPLVLRALARGAARMDRDPPRVGAADLERLRAAPWPGNVRELENVIERALVLSTGDVLELPESCASSAVERSGAATARFDEAQRRTIEDALRASGGRLYGAAGAAARLGLAPSTLQSKMQKLGIKRRG